MSSATITSKGQLTVPAAIREELGLKTGDRVDFIRNNETGNYEIIPATLSIRSLKGILPKLRVPLSIREMNEAIADEGSSRG